MTGTLPLWIVTGLYCWQAGAAAWNGQWAQAVILTGYTIANLGLIWSMRVLP